MSKEYALITGATGVIGGCFAESYVKRGYNLFITGRSEGSLAALKERLSALPEAQRFGIDIMCFACDLSDAAQRDKMYESIRESGINITRAALVAGADDEGPFAEYSKDRIRRMLRVNAESTIEITSELIALRREQTGTEGFFVPLKIIVVASLAAYFRMPLMALYSASKRTLYHFFLALKEELKDTGVSATLVLPGAVRTRPDIIERIEAQGFFGKISCVAPQKLAEKSVKLAEKKRLIYVPGVFNKILRTLSFIVPARLVSKMAGAKWREAAKKKNKII